MDFMMRIHGFYLQKPSKYQEKGHINALISSHYPEKYGVRLGVRNTGIPVHRRCDRDRDLGDADQRHDIAPDTNRYPQGLNCFLEGIGLNIMVDLEWGIVEQSDNSPKKCPGTISVTLE
jgi:hypothetical protein